MTKFAKNGEIIAYTGQTSTRFDSVRRKQKRTKILRKNEMHRYLGTFSAQAVRD